MKNIAIKPILRNLLNKYSKINGGDAGSRTRVRIGIELRFLHVYCCLVFEVYQVQQKPNVPLSYMINFSLVEMS